MPAQCCLSVSWRWRVPEEMIPVSQASLRVVALCSCCCLLVILQQTASVVRTAKNGPAPSTSAKSIIVATEAPTTVACPCDDPQWCRPLATPAVHKPREVYGFANTGQQMNWTHVTTVAWADDDLTCRAHAHGVKSVLAAPAIDLTNLTSAEARQSWAAQALDLVRDRFRDGIVFDYEGPVTDHPTWGDIYADLITETYRLFKRYNSYYQVSVCVPWSPDDIDGRNYPWTSMTADLYYVMDYDTRSQIYDSVCIAGPNAPFPGMIRGLQRWQEVGIPYRKIVLGVPWYGYNYPCLNTTAIDDTFCPIQPVPFRGVNCSDAAGSEIAYDRILSLMTESGATPVQRDDNTGSPYFNYRSKDGTVYQLWFDDPVLLRRKYEWVRNNGLLGVGPFMYDYLDDAPTEERVKMWSALDSLYSSNTGQRAEALLSAEQS
jgi:Di-N-acetylchitobiase